MRTRDVERRGDGGSTLLTLPTLPPPLSLLTLLSGGGSTLDFPWMPLRGRPRGRGGQWALVGETLVLGPYICVKGPSGGNLHPAPSWVQKLTTYSPPPFVAYRPNIPRKMMTNVFHYRDNPFDLRGGAGYRPIFVASWVLCPNVHETQNLFGPGLTISSMIQPHSPRLLQTREREGTHSQRFKILL